MRVAATFVRERQDRLPEGERQATAAQGAVLAIRIHQAFLGRDEGTDEPAG